MYTANLCWLNEVAEFFWGKNKKKKQSLVDSIQIPASYPKAGFLLSCLFLQKLFVVPLLVMICHFLKDPYSPFRERGNIVLLFCFNFPLEQ